MPIPTPKKGEKKSKFISRCITAIAYEYPPEQRAAICYDKWNKSKKNEIRDYSIRQ